MEIEEKIDSFQKSLPELSELALLIEELNNSDDKTLEYLFKKAREVCEKIYGKDIYISGLIEFTNYCKKDCYYC